MSIFNIFRVLKKDAKHDSASHLANTASAPQQNVQGPDVQAKFLEAVALHKEGQLPEAQAMYEDILKTQPDHADSLHYLGVIAIQSNNHKHAVDLIGKAISVNPNSYGFYINHGTALKECNQLEAAVASYDKAIAIKPDVADVYYNRGVALQELKQFDAAIASYDKAIDIKPDYAGAYANRGVVLQELKQLETAVASLDKAIAIQPDFAEAYSNRGAALQKLKQLEAALASLDKAIAIKPDYAGAYANRGNVLKDLQQPAAAVASYDTAIVIQPDYAEAYANRGIALEDLGAVEQAEKSYRMALEINPQLPEAHHSLAFMMQTEGDTQAAMQSYRSALAYAPHREDSHTGLLYCLSSDANVDAPTLFAEHVRFGEQFEAPLRAQWQPHTNTTEPERTLKVGFVSGDFWNHAVATFIEPVLQELSKSSQFSLHAYYNHTVQDAVTQRLKTYFAHWSPAAGMSDAALAQKIRADGIDILIDLSGHTAMHRLLTFAHKPAPVQASWIGFPGTTGLQAMDYYLTDRFFLPPGQFDNQFTEKLVYLPASAPFLPSAEAPEVNALPALSNGFITFGSFNRRNKINPAVIALWAQVLHAQPNSHMLIGGMESAQNPHLLGWFANEGIAGERLSFFQKSDMKTYLGLHHQVDICLDTFPYNGGTTTLHAMWMGVPTLTLSGQTPASRTGSFILGHMGLQAFQAHDVQEYVNKSGMWTDKLDELSQIRGNMRERFAATAVGQPPVIAAGLERAFRTMWQRWCGQSPVESFEAI